MNNRQAHDQLIKAASHALSRLPQTRVWQIEPFIGFDDEGTWHNAGMHQPGGKSRGPLDLLVVSHGKAIFLDAKTGSAVLSKVQQDFARVVRLAGGVAEPFGSVEDALRIIEEVTR